MSRFNDMYVARIAAGEIQSDPAQQAILPEFDRILTALDVPVKKSLFRKPPEPPKGLYLWGGVGRGKSMMMDLFVEQLNVPVRRVHFHAFMQEIHAAMHVARSTGIADSLAPVAEKVIAEAKVLAFDEMQITDITDAMIVGRLFEILFKAGVVVITTSNRLPDALYKDGLNRQLFLPFIEVLKDQMVVWELIGPNDYRQNRLAGTPVYFSPITAQNQQKIQQIWEHLSGGPAAPLILKVKGREVEIPHFRNGVARASFYDLCGRMLGAGDYLALAAETKVLILEDIPRLGRSNFNEAKRFVILIDALYEAKVRLICSAADDPESLYIEGEGVFEFERTASRLREMQSDEWAASA